MKRMIEKLVLILNNEEQVYSEVELKELARILLRLSQYQ